MQHPDHATHATLVQYRGEEPANVSSGDGSNRSNRPSGSPRQPTRKGAPQRQRQTWDVDPAEIDRYLSGRPSRAEEAAARTSDSSTADQLSRLQNAVGRGAAPAEGNRTQATYRGRATRTPEPRYEPNPAAPMYDDEPIYDDYIEETWDTPAQQYSDDEGVDDSWDQSAYTQRPTRQSGPRQQAPRQQRQYEPEPLDVYDDEEFYNDDPYLSYEDDEIDRRPPRASRTARPRTQPKMTRPNLPSVTIPKALTDSPLISDRPALIMIGIALVSVALMSFLVSDRLELLGDVIPTHVSASGDPENIKTREAVWNIPLLAGMVMLMNVAAAWFVSRIDHFASRFLLAAGLLVNFIAWVAVIKYLWE
jgi:hypothetical protein